MGNRGARFAKRVLAYILAFILIGVVYISTAFIIEHIFCWLGDEDGMSWSGTLSGCIFCAAVIIIIDIRRSKQAQTDRSTEIIKVCRRILTTTALMFGGFVLMEWLIIHEPGTEFVFDTEHFLPLALSIAIFDYLYERRKERLVERDERRLVVAAAVADMHRAEAICGMLEAQGIKAMIVEQGSPIYIQGSGEPLQIQVTNGDLARAKELIEQIAM